MKRLILTISFFILLTILQSQNPVDTLWTRTFGGNELDWGHSIQQTIDGGYIITGITMSYGPDVSAVWLIKTDPDGIEEWNQTFGGNSMDAGYSVQQTNDEGYIIGGMTYSFGAGENDIWIIKTDTDGIEEWNQTFGGSFADNGTSIKQTIDGGFIISGHTQIVENGEYDILLIKINANGTEEWTQTFGGAESEYCQDVIQTNDDGFIICGTTRS